MGIENLANDKEQVSPLSDSCHCRRLWGGMQKGYEIEFFQPQEIMGR